MSDKLYLFLLIATLILEGIVMAIIALIVSFMEMSCWICLILLLTGYIIRYIEVKYANWLTKKYEKLKEGK